MCFPGTIILSCFSNVFVFPQWSGVWLQRSSDPAVLQCREPKHPVQSQVLFQGHREVWLCGGTASHSTHSFHVVYVLLLGMHGICMRTVQYRYPFTYHMLNKTWTPCALLTYPGLNCKHESVYANLNIWCFVMYWTLLLQILLL